MSDDPGYRRGYAAPGDATREVPASARPGAGRSAGPAVPPPGSARQQVPQLPLPPELDPRKRGRRKAPPVAPPAGDQPYGDGPDEPGRGPRRRRPRRFGWGKRLLALLVVLLLIFLGLMLFWDSRLTRVDALKGYSGRPTSSGTNWLMIGSDSRAGLTDQQKKDLATGNAAGSRTDTIMLVHIGSAGTSLVSLPRDTYVPIPGHGRNKLNAAYSLGGASLLTRTVEEATGLRIDHFAQIGFGGFAAMVDAIGGVRLCIAQPINDPKAGLNIPGGCQTLNGPQALGYVRTRAFANADLDRVRHQREFLAALVSQSATPGVVLNPFKSVPLGTNAVDTLTVDNGTHIWAVARLGLALRGLSGGKGVTTTVPVGRTGPVSGVGDVVYWDRTNAGRLFDALGHDKTVPADLRK